MTGLVFAIVAVCQHFYPPHTSPSKETTKWVLPSPWLAELMGVCMWLLMTLLPASLVSQAAPVPSPYRASRRAGVCKSMILRSTTRSASPIDSSISRADYRLYLPLLAHTCQ
jgi:hypothetical protein